MQRRKREITRILYGLGRRFGFQAELHRAVDTEMNVLTGAQDQTITIHKIRRFVTFDVSVSSKFQYGLSFLAANSNFAHGNIFEVGDRLGFVSYRDLPKGYEPTKTDVIIVNSKRYVIHKYEELDANAGYMYHLRHTKGSVNAT